jgi:diguanylate cyclase (GGDEF)-like protein
VGTLLLTLWSKVFRHTQKGRQGTRPAVRVAKCSETTATVATGAGEAPTTADPSYTSGAAPPTVCLGEGVGISTAVVVTALAAVIGLVALLALSTAFRRRGADARLQSELESLGTRLESLADQIESSTRRPLGMDAGLGDAIGSTIDLGEVLRRALAAMGAVPAVDGAEVEVVTEGGALVREARGVAPEEAAARPVYGPPDGRRYRSATVAYGYEQGADETGAVRSALAVPLQGESELGTLRVYSRLEHAFGSEAVEILTAVARRAAPAVANALRHRAVTELSITDELTGLLNRRGYDQALERELALARRANRPLALLIVDLDHFSEVNNEFGLPAGDAALATFADCVRTAVRTTDIACRRGGEEFAIILPETTCQQGVLAYNRLRAVVAGTLFPRVESLTFSAGLSDLRAGDERADIDARAAAAEANAKRLGRNQLSADCLGLTTGG